MCLSTTLSNRFLDHCRRRRAEVLRTPALRVVQGDSTGEPMPAAQWERVTRADFLQAVEQLRPPRLREAYRRHASGLRYRAIAQQLRTPEGTLGRWLSEARQALYG